MGAFVETEAATGAAERAADTGSAAAAGDRGQGGRCRGPSSARAGRQRALPRVRAQKGESERE